MKKKSKYEGKFCVGQSFGKWTVINPTIILEKTSKIMCRCECGTEKLVTIFNLKSGISKQCRKCADKLKNIQIIPQSMINEIKKFAEKNKISFELTDKDIMDISVKYVLEKKKLESVQVYNMSAQVSGCCDSTISASYSLYPIVGSSSTLCTTTDSTSTSLQAFNTGGGIYGAGQLGYISHTGSYIVNAISTPTTNYEPYLYRVDESKGYTRDNTVVVNKSDVLSQRNSTSIQSAASSLENIKTETQKFKTNSTLNFLLNRRD